MIIIGILTAVISGILMSVQGVCNTAVSGKAGLWTTGVFVSLTAALCCFLIRIFGGNAEDFNLLGTVRPRYLLLGGLFGALITGTVVLSISRLGTARAELVIVVSQLAAAYCIALNGWFGSVQEPFSWRRMLALLIAACGVILYSF